MKHNPWGDLIKTIDRRVKKSLPEFGSLGAIVSVEPMKIEFNGVVIDRDIFYIDTMVGKCKTGDNVLVIPNKDMTQFFIVGRMING